MAKYKMGNGDEEEKQSRLDVNLVITLKVKVKCGPRLLHFRAGKAHPVSDVLR